MLPAARFRGIKPLLSWPRRALVRHGRHFLVSPLAVLCLCRQVSWNSTDSCPPLSLRVSSISKDFYSPCSFPRLRRRLFYKVLLPGYPSVGPCLHTTHGRKGCSAVSTRHHGLNVRGSTGTRCFLKQIWRFVLNFQYFSRRVLMLCPFWSSLWLPLRPETL